MSHDQNFTSFHYNVYILKSTIFKIHPIFDIKKKFFTYANIRYKVPSLPEKSAKQLHV
jgi:hypothetical protein